MLSVFRSEMQLQLLAAILLEPTREWHLQELAQLIHAPVSSVHRELDRAVASGVVERDDTVRPHRFTAAIDSPFFVPLAQLMRLTVGVERQLRDALADLPIDVAALHGSWVDGALRPSSDVDLLVVGDVKLEEVRRRVRPVSKSARRTIDVTVFGRDEFGRLVRQRASFARHLQDDTTVDLIGDLSEMLRQ
jgi:predicted nucleotidyltransferase